MSMAGAARTLSPSEAERWTRIGVLSAVAMLLGYLESFVPIPLPGVKLGLANIAVLVALSEHDLSGAFFVGLVKVLATGLLFGNPVTLAYSATGTLLAFACMAPLSCLPTMRLEMVSVVGALAHETGQLLVAQLMLGTGLVWYSAPVLAVAGCATGLLCGIAASAASRQLRGLSHASVSPGRVAAEASRCVAAPQDRTVTPCRGLLALVGYLVLVVAIMHVHAVAGMCICLAFSLCLCLLSRMSLRTVLAALAPTLPIALVALIAQVASAQQGQAIVTIGPMAATKEALVAAGLMCFRLGCISTTSVAVVRLAGRDRLAQAAHLALQPLRTLGLRTEGPELAFSTALRLVSQLAVELQDKASARTILSREFWSDQLPKLVGELYRQSLETVS